VVWQVARDATAIEAREKPKPLQPATNSTSEISGEKREASGEKREASGEKREASGEKREASGEKREASVESAVREALPEPAEIGLFPVDFGPVEPSKEKEPIPEKAVSPLIEAPPPKRRRGRPRKGEVVPPPEPTRIERQRTQTLEEMLRELPRVCNVGTKTNAQGHKDSWIGYKFHADLTEIGIPLAGLTTSASLHDSQVAIPLHRLTKRRVEVIFYELMDSAYDAPGIKAEVREAGSVPIIEPNPRRGPKPPPMGGSEGAFRLGSSPDL
jgi:hypothetical protein